MCVRDTGLDSGILVPVSVSITVKMCVRDTEPDSGSLVSVIRYFIWKPDFLTSFIVILIMDD